MNIMRVREARMVYLSSPFRLMNDNKILIISRVLLIKY
jgi:hypothetical protein